MSTCIPEMLDVAAANERAVAVRRRMIADAMMLRALAVRALRDGLPKSELRAANARVSARRLLHHARQIAKFDVDIKTTEASDL